MNSCNANLKFLATGLQSSQKVLRSSVNQFFQNPISFLFRLRVSLTQEPVLEFSQVYGAHFVVGTFFNHE